MSGVRAGGGGAEAQKPERGGQCVQSREVIKQTNDAFGILTL